MFHWIAHYIDGSTLDQREGFTYADIDRSRILAFGLYRPDNNLIILIDFRDDTNGDADIGPKRLIWRKRSLQNSQGDHVQIHLAGWQRKVAGRNVQSVCYINELGEVILGGQWMEDKPLTHAIIPLECEKDLA